MRKANTKKPTIERINPLFFVLLTASSESLNSFFVLILGQRNIINPNIKIIATKINLIPLQ